MSYMEIIKKALRGRSVNAAAKQWGIPQQTLDRYAKGRLPDYQTAKIIAAEAGISAGEMLELLAAEEGKKRSRVQQISEGFKSLLRIANASWKQVPAAA